MSLEKNLYQLIIGRLDGENISSSTYHKKIFSLVRRGIGGFIVFGGEKKKLKKFLKGLQVESEIPLLIASDIERGVGQQVKGTTTFPCQMALSAAINFKKPPDVKLLRTVIKAIAEESTDIGINMPLIPVLDVNLNPLNPIICTRAFSDNPLTVANFGKEFIKGLEGMGLISCAKHFPGHGDTSVDSHIELPVIRKSYHELERQDLLPFKDVIKSCVSSVMVGHLLIPAIDSMPATLSKKIITGLLRGKLGFNGLILTDALNMGALKGIKELYTSCIKAGADILLHPTEPELAVKELLFAIKMGRLTEERIDASISRILKAKDRLKHIKRRPLNYRHHERLSAHIRQRSMTLVKGSMTLLPVKGAVTLIAVYTDIKAWGRGPDIPPDEVRRINKIIKGAIGPSIVISFGSPYVLKHFKEADMLIAAYEGEPSSEKAVIDCLKGRTAFTGRQSVDIFRRCHGV